MARAMSGTRRRTGWPGRLAALGLAGCLLVVQAAQAAESVTYFHFDALGSPVAATDEAGNVLWREAYRPYGERLRDEAGADQDLWYTGKPEEAEFGLQYFGARWYDPRTGRFQGLDPTGFVEDNIHSFNRYAYAVNNPYKFRDPDGRYIETAFDAVSLGLSFSAFVNEPSWGNFAALAYDGAATVAPFIPGGAGVVRAGATGTSKAAQSTADVARGAVKPKPGVLGESGRFPKSVMDQARRESQDTCVFCGVRTTNKSGPTRSEIDHAIPKSSGGARTIDNAQNTCRTCNRSKGARTTDEFLEDLE